MEAASPFTDFPYGENTRFLNETINKLRACGSEAILGEMPKIAVIGNQSAGKSSLIEAMSGVDSSLFVTLTVDSRSTTGWDMHSLPYGGDPDQC